jgi:hypothetical protein
MLLTLEQPIDFGLQKNKELGLNRGLYQNDKFWQNKV